MNDKLLKGLGIVATVVGAVASVASGVISEKQQDVKLEKLVDKKFAEKVTKG